MMLSSLAPDHKQASETTASFRVGRYWHQNAQQYAAIYIVPNFQLQTDSRTSANLRRTKKNRIEKQQAILLIGSRNPKKKHDHPKVQNGSR